MIKNSRKKVVFDIDDILWPLNKRAAKMADIAYDDLVTYSIDDNPRLNEAEKLRLRDVYLDPSLFEDINFYDGIERINDLDADVYTNSNVFSRKAEELKKQQLMRKLNIPAENYIFNRVTEDNAKKQIGPDVYIFIDDCPHNIMHSDAVYNIMRTMPYNEHMKNCDIYDRNHKKKNIIFCNDLNQIITTIERLLAQCK